VIGGRHLWREGDVSVIQSVGRTQIINQLFAWWMRRPVLWGHSERRIQQRRRRDARGSLPPVIVTWMILVSFLVAT